MEKDEAIDLDLRKKSLIGYPDPHADARVVAARESAHPIFAQPVERPEHQALPPPGSHHRVHVLAESRRDGPVEGEEAVRVMEDVARAAVPRHVGAGSHPVVAPARYLVGRSSRFRKRIP